MQQFINYWSTVLTAPVTASFEDTSLSVDPAIGDLLPALGAIDHISMTLYELDEDSGEEIRREIVRCNAYADGGLEVYRGQEGTVVQAWAAGTHIEVRLTAEALTQVFTEVAQLQRYRAWIAGGAVELNQQKGAFVVAPTTNAAELLIGFDYATEEIGAIQIDLEMYSPNWLDPFVLTLLNGNGLLCELPAGSSVEATDSTTYEITLPPSELYIMELRGLDSARLRITTYGDYQVLAAPI